MSKRIDKFKVTGFDPRFQKELIDNGFTKSDEFYDRNMLENHAWTREFTANGKTHTIILGIFQMRSFDMSHSQPWKTAQNVEHYNNGRVVIDVWQNDVGDSAHKCYIIHTANALKRLGTLNRKFLKNQKI